MFLALPGLFVGLLIWSRVGHLLQNFVGVDSKNDAAKGKHSASTRHQIRIISMFVAGWLAIFSGLAYYVFSTRGEATGWFWFFIGIITTPGVILPPLLFFWLRHSRSVDKYTAALRTNAPADTLFVYKIKFDETYIQTMSKRYLRQLPMGGSFRSNLVAIAGIATAFWIFNPLGNNAAVVAGLVLALGVPAVFAAEHASRRLIYSDFGYASHMGKSSIYTVSAKGLEVVGPRPCHEAIWPAMIAWPRVMRAARFRDGILLCGFGGVTENLAPAWLPDSALQDAQPGDVSRFIEEMMQPRTVKKLY